MKYVSFTRALDVSAIPRRGEVNGLFKWKRGMMEKGVYIQLAFPKSKLAFLLDTRDEDVKILKSNNWEVVEFRTNRNLNRDLYTTVWNLTRASNWRYLLSFKKLKLQDKRNKIIEHFMGLQQENTLSIKDKNDIVKMFKK